MSLDMTMESRAAAFDLTDERIETEAAVPITRMWLQDVLAIAGTAFGVLLSSAALGGGGAVRRGHRVRARHVTGRGPGGPAPGPGPAPVRWPPVNRPPVKPAAREPAARETGRP